MDLHPSRITPDADGWTWLAPDRRGGQLRLGFWSAVLSVLLIVLAAAATLPPPLIAVPLVAVVLGGGLALAGRLWNRAHSAVAVSALGLAVRSGFDTAQVGWPGLAAVVAEPAGRRMRIVVEARGGRHRTAGTFSRGPALAWLALCQEHAARHHMRPEPIAGADGFRTR